MHAKHLCICQPGQAVSCIPQYTPILLFSIINKCIIQEHRRTTCTFKLTRTRVYLSDIKHQPGILQDAKVAKPSLVLLNSLRSTARHSTS